MKKLILLPVVICLSLVVHAEGDKQMTDKEINAYALKETQKVMTSESERQKLIQVDPKAKAADDAVVKAVGSGSERDELYRMAADYMKTLSEKSNGDTEAMKRELMKASQDPATFLKNLPPDMQIRIREIASTVEKRNGTVKEAPPQP